ncbi:S8/S53 family peptidase [Deinococcus aquaticus]|uniref:S8/S53 family peptidase n=1 Tax=Deinococcus aquaticus TaxID=328692 RepID=A0ABY7V281_9DEIO|nr:S8/S53 family peptidase [Deinococcus aquaticus]WDA58835.1 S8/S53 family peptidase [Deinococcus aquaticus]
MNQKNTKKLELSIKTGLRKIECRADADIIGRWLCKLPETLVPGSYSISLVEDELVVSAPYEIKIIDREHSSIFTQYDRTIFEVEKTNMLPIIYIDESNNIFLPVNSDSKYRQPFLILADRFKSLDLKDKEKYMEIMRQYSLKLNKIKNNFYKRYTGPEIVTEVQEVEQIRQDFSGLMEEGYLFYPILIRNGRFDLDISSEIAQIKIGIDRLNLDGPLEKELKSKVENNYRRPSLLNAIYPMNYSPNTINVDFDDIDETCQKPFADFSVDISYGSFYSNFPEIIGAGSPAPTTEPFTGTADYSELLGKNKLIHLLEKSDLVMESAEYYMGISGSPNKGSKEVDVFVIDTSRIDNNGIVTDSFVNQVKDSSKIYTISGHGSIIARNISKLVNQNVAVRQLSACQLSDCSLARTAQVICDAILHRISTGRHVVVNLSMTYTIRSSLMDRVLKSAMKNGVWIVVANGNADRYKIQPVSPEASGFIDQRQYPAYDAISYSRMINVGGLFINEKMQLVDFFDNGATALPKKYEAQTYAPALDIYGDPASMPHLGTSFSVPYVTAALANTLTQLPEDCRASRDKIATFISRKTDIGSGNKENINIVDFSKGRLNSSQISELCK